MMCRPIAFWRAITLQMPVRLGRALSVVACSTLLVFLGRVTIRWLLVVLGWTTSIEVYIAPRNAWVFHTDAFQIYEIGYLIVSCAGVPVLYALLCPVVTKSLRNASVRWVHLARVTVYAISTLPLLLVVVFTATFACKVAERSYAIKQLPHAWLPVMRSLQLDWVLLWPVILIIWWWAAFRWYLHLKRPLVGSIVIGVSAVIATGMAVAIISAVRQCL